MAYLAPLRALLISKQMRFSEQEGRHGEAVMGFVVIENLYVDDAAHLVDSIFRDVFGLDSLNVRVWGQGVMGIAVASKPS